ncbi:MAG: hypothetical protein IT210_18220, partial [Armatimonadetes bacterium]|nr:hypothetical protein [Armatimonadota bacterium]
AQPLEIQARGEFHRFDPVEVIATAEKTKRLLSAHASEPFLLFPEDHRYPIRMTDELPLRWIQSGPSQSFRGEACRNEFYVFRIGVYAFSRELNSLQGTFEDLKSTQGGIVPASALRCFNLGGSDFAGHAFRKTVSVERGKIQALWLGVQVPRDAAPGSYEGRFTLQPEGERAAQVKLTLDVSDRTLEDCGDIDLWRPSRLRWLDSAIASMRMWRIPLRL